MLKCLMKARHENLFELELSDKSTALLDILQKIGHMPLPPYIDLRRMKMPIKNAIRRSTIKFERGLWLHQLLAYILMMSY